VAEALIFLFIVVLVLPSVAAALALRSLARRNRITPRVPTLAPLNWLWSWGGPARLHRRLCRNAATARMCAIRRPHWTAVADVTAELEARAVALDEQLVFATHATRNLRRRLLAEAAAEVREVEMLTQRVLRMTSAPLPVPQGPPPLALRDRVDALEHALRELT
jgi:hypothetical protein